MEKVGQKYNDEGFDDVEQHSTLTAIFNARRKGFLEGWMAVVNALNLPSSSSFKDSSQVSLLEDPTKAPVEENPTLEQFSHAGTGRVDRGLDRHRVD